MLRTARLVLHAEYDMLCAIRGVPHAVYYLLCATSRVPNVGCYMLCTACRVRPPEALPLASIARHPSLDAYPASNSEAIRLEVINPATSTAGFHAPSRFSAPMRLMRQLPRWTHRGSVGAAAG